MRIEKKILVLIILLITSLSLGNIINSNYQGTLELYNDSNINIYNKAQVDSIELFDNSSLFIFDAYINYIKGYNNSYVEIFNPNGNINILMTDNSCLKIWTHGEPIFFEEDEYKGISGISFRNREPFKYYFLSDNTKDHIIYIPEPVTIIMLLFGTLFLGKIR